MKTYIGTKIITAEPMTRGDYNQFKGWVMPENENPLDDGYLVKYSDDYISWSPKEAFEEAYIGLGENELYDTCLLMKSNDFKDRFKAEYLQLKLRISGLKTMLGKYKVGTLPFKPKSSYELFYEQLFYMQGYMKSIEERAKIEGIEL